VSVCSCVPATMLDSQDESITGFAQQSHPYTLVLSFTLFDFVELF
jgi:hypothetical protein